MKLFLLRLVLLAVLLFFEICGWGWVVREGFGWGGEDEEAGWMVVVRRGRVDELALPPLARCASASQATTAK